jgi:tRNA 2-thiouridine synthesizing protein C
LTVTDPIKKSVLIVLTHSPYGTSLARASLDVALANAAFEQPVDLLFLGDGVLQLQPDQDGKSLGIKNRGRQLASLPLYDIDSVYVDAEASDRYNLDLKHAPLDSQAVDPEKIHELMVTYHHLLSF